MKQNHYTFNRCLLFIVPILFLVNGLSAQSFDIYVFNIKKGTTRKVTHITNGGEFNPTWSPNGKKIAHDVTDTAASHAQSIFITNIKSGISKPLIGAEGGNDPAWSPVRDKEHNKRGSHNKPKSIIAFDDWLNIYTVPAKGGTRSLFRSSCHHANWSPEGNKIAFADNSGYIGTKDLRTGNETFITSSADWPSWSPDGKYIAFNSWAGGVWVIRVDKWGNPQGAAVQLTTSGFGPTWSDNSKTIYYIDYPTGDPDVWSIRVTGGTATRVCGRVGGFDKGDYDPACSHNGKFIAFSSYTDPPVTAQKNTTQSNTAESNTAQSNIAKIAAPSIQKSTVSNNFSLEQNRPNPFTNETKISFKVALFTHVTLTVYNISGQKIKTFADANYEAGSYTINWNGKDNAGNTLPAGIYLCQMQAGSFIQTKKMILMQ